MILSKIGVAVRAAAALLLLCGAAAASSGTSAPKDGVGPDGKPLIPAKLSDIHVSVPWMRAARAGEAGHVFFSVRNDGPVPVTLRGGETGASDNVRLIRFSVMGMYLRTELLDPVVIPPHGSFSFEPGVAALELWQLHQNLDKGARLPVVLDFEKVGTVRTNVEVDSRTAIRYPDPPPRPKGEGDGSGGSGGH